MTPQQYAARKIVLDMKGWYRDINDPKANKKKDRTVPESCFDSGVFAASELVRRMTGDEQLALAIHELCIWRQREHALKPSSDGGGD